jgi:hypothetical protein
MKPSKKKLATKHRGTRQPSAPRTKASIKQRPTRSAVPAATKKKETRPKARRRPTAAKAPAPVQETPAELPGFAQEILKELRTLQAAVLPKVRASRGNDDGLDSATTSIRRLLSDYLERDHETLLHDLVLARQSLTDPQRLDPAAALVLVDRLIKRLGGLEFSARELDFVDPAIHEIKAERCLERLPDEVVAESLRPGIRSRNGAVIAKAWIAINRRSAHESARD